MAPFLLHIQMQLSPVVQLSLISLHPFHKSSETAPIPKVLCTEGKHKGILPFINTPYTQLKNPRLQLAAWKYNAPRFIKVPEHKGSVNMACWT
jgi:hypothetical protein